MPLFKQKGSWWIESHDNNSGSQRITQLVGELWSQCKCSETRQSFKVWTSEKIWEPSSNPRQTFPSPQLTTWLIMWMGFDKARQMSISAEAPGNEGFTGERVSFPAWELCVPLLIFSLSPTLWSISKGKRTGPEDLGYWAGGCGVLSCRTWGWWAAQESLQWRSTNEGSTGF